MPRSRRSPGLVAAGELVRASPALSGCALMLLLLGAVSLLLPCAVDDLLERAVRSWQADVEARLADDVPDDERTALAWAFDDAVYAIRSGRHDAEALERVRRRIEAGGRFDLAGVRELTAELRRVPGGG